MLKTCERYKVTIIQFLNTHLKEYENLVFLTEYNWNITNALMNMLKSLRIAINQYLSVYYPITYLILHIYRYYGVFKYI